MMLIIRAPAAPGPVSSASALGPEGGSRSSQVVPGHSQGWGGAAFLLLGCHQASAAQMADTREVVVWPP